MITDIDEINKSEITRFVAEVFHEELKFIMGGAEGKEIWVKNHGMNSRAFSKDILEVTNFNHNSMMQAQHDTIFIHVSRNSIYHQLPEILFHPLTISNPTMSNREIVEAIRENKKKEEDNIHFFIPFDTYIFKEKLKLTNRFLNIFIDKSAKQNLFSIASSIIRKNIKLPKEQSYKFFLDLCNSEFLKENLPEIQKMFHSIMNIDILLEYKTCVLRESPFMPLGSGILGFDLGTQGPVISEQDDLCATVLLDQQQDYETLEDTRTIVTDMLKFFVFSNRDIIVQFRFLLTNGLLLGENYLGYDTILKGKENKINKTTKPIPHNTLEDVCV